MAPTLVIACGYWCDESIYEPTTKLLRAKGFKVEVPGWPTTGTVSPGNLNMSDDTAAFRTAVINVLDRGEDVFVVAHSAGAFLGGDGLKDLLKKDKPPGEASVVGAALIAGFAVPAPLACVNPEFSAEDDIKRMPKDPGQFFNDVADEAEKQKWIARIKPQPSQDYDRTMSYYPYPELPNVFILTERDAVLPPQLLESFAAAAHSKKIIRIDAGHMAPATAPEVCAKAIEEAIVECC